VCVCVCINSSMRRLLIEIIAKCEWCQIVHLKFQQNQQQESLSCEFTQIA